MCSPDLTEPRTKPWHNAPRSLRMEGDWGLFLRSLVRTSLLGVVAATIPLGFACSGGGPEKVDAGDWVAEVCGAAIDFEAELQESAESLQVLTEGDPDDIKHAIDQFSNDAKETI